MSGETSQSCPPTFASSPEDPNDSGVVMDDNNLTTGLLAETNDEDHNTLTSNDDEHRTAPRWSYASAWKVMRRIGPYLASYTLLAMLFLVPYVIYQALSDKKFEIAAFHSAAVMVVGTLIMSARLVYLHFTHWYMPEVQKYVVRILFMVPIYAVQSWLSLRFHHARIYIDAIRDLYEAFAIASFVYYLIELLGGEEALAQTLRQKVRDDPSLAEHLGHHNFPLSLILEPWELGVEFMLQCKHGVLQYVVAKTLFTVLTYILQSLGMYGEGKFVLTSPYAYLTFSMNISVMYALYSLVKLFHAVQNELRCPIDWHPLGKFLCIKGVVFFTWWQGVLIKYLKYYGIIGDVGNRTGDEVADGLIDYCICVEMVMFAIAHSFSFTYMEYLPSTVESAIVGYEQVQQQYQEQRQDTGSDILEDNNDNNNNGGATNNSFSYNPPEMLTRPAKFKDAFWSSTVPRETLNDIWRLQNGVNRAASRVTEPGDISLQGPSLTATTTTATTTTLNAAGTPNNDCGDDDQAHHHRQQQHHTV